jgi:FkbM family methyltransferase
VSQIARIIKKLPTSLQKFALQLLYLKNGKFLQDFKSFNNGQFYAYKIKGMYVPSEAIDWYLDYKYYQEWVLAISAFAYRPKKGDVIIDIGAGIGEEAIVYSGSVGAKGKVYAIEANPEVFEVLKKIVALNNLENIQLYNIAINVADEPVKISIEQSSFLGGSIGVAKASNKSFIVEGLRFDSFAQKNAINKIDFLKVNIEGAERFVIETIGNHISTIRNIAISCHDFRYGEDNNPFFKTKAMVSEYLQNHDFIVSSQSTGKPFIDDWVYGTRKYS